MRTTKLLTVSLPPDLARRTEEVAREESRTKSELLREALRLYIDTREARRAAIAKRQLFELIDRVQERVKGENPESVRALVGEAVKAVRGTKRKRRRL